MFFSKDRNQERVMHSKSYNMDVMVYYKADEVIQ